MKIVAPLPCVEACVALTAAGADEFYCGFVPYEWLKKYLNVSAINRRELLAKSNITTYSAMQKLGSISQYLGVPIAVTFNSHFYSYDQYNYIMEIIERLQGFGFNTFIVSDIGLISYLRRNGVDCNLHLSGEAVCLNNKAAEVYGDFGIQRFIIPRQTTVQEIDEFINKTKQLCSEFEAFFANTLCLYCGGFCNSMHADEIKNICSLRSSVQCWETEAKRTLPVIDRTSVSLSWINNSRTTDCFRENRLLFGSETRFVKVCFCNGVCNSH